MGNELERVKGFEPTTSCLGSTKEKRQESLASFLKGILACHHLRGQCSGNALLSVYLRHLSISKSHWLSYLPYFSFAYRSKETIAMLIPFQRIIGSRPKETP